MNPERHNHPKEQESMAWYHWVSFGLIGLTLFSLSIIESQMTGRQAAVEQRNIESLNPVQDLPDEQKTQPNNDPILLSINSYSSGALLIEKHLSGQDNKIINQQLLNASQPMVMVRDNLQGIANLSLHLSNADNTNIRSAYPMTRQVQANGDTTLIIDATKSALNQTSSFSLSTISNALQTAHIQILLEKP